MRARVWAAFVCAILATPLLFAGSRRDVFKLQLELARAQLEREARRLSTCSEDVAEAFARYQQLAAAFAEAARSGESWESLELRASDLARARGELEAALDEAAQARRAFQEARWMVETLEEKVKKAAGAASKHPDPITGKWRLVVEPGGLEGVMHLELDGTLVNGSYELSGGWYGSLRGTFVAGKLRLERIDSQLGFVAIYYGQLFSDQEPMVIHGRWEATNLTAGTPSAGPWMAEKLEEQEE